MNKAIVITEEQLKELNSDEVYVDPYEPKDELNKHFWIDGKLNSKIRLRLLDIADDFYNNLDIKWIKPVDIVLTGSIANYNWTIYSDIDIHIIIDYEKVFKKKEFVKSYFDSKKELWGLQHDNLKILGFPVELYVEDLKSPAVSSGVYSLETNEWIVEPKDMKDEKLNKEYIQRMVAKYATKIEKLEKKIEDEDDKVKINEFTDKLEKIFDRLKDVRKEGLKSEEQELSSGNIIWKILRNEGYIEKIWDIINYNYDVSNSITESKINEAFQKYGRLKKVLEQLGEINSYNGRIQFCNKVFGEPIGRGSSRLVFQINDELVLKLAINEKGIAQNYQEYSVKDHVMKDLMTFDSQKYNQENEKWIISEYVIPAKKIDFNKVYGVSFDFYCDLLTYKFIMAEKKYKYWYFEDFLLDRIETLEKQSLDTSEYRTALKNEDFIEFLDNINTYITEYDGAVGDLRRISSYGLTKRNRKVKIVLLDSGLSNDVYNSYYSYDRPRRRAMYESMSKAEINREANKADKHPTDAQKKSGNYKLGHINVLGFDISIENPKGSYRYWTDENGNKGKNKINHHYGYFKRSNGHDGDQVDVFIGNNIKSEKIFVIDQNAEDGSFDESKVMLGFNTAKEAKDAYLSNYNKDWKGFRDITCVDKEEFRKWLYDGRKQQKPFAEYKNIKKIK